MQYSYKYKETLGIQLGIISNETREVAYTEDYACLKTSVSQSGSHFRENFLFKIIYWRVCTEAMVDPGWGIWDKSPPPSP